MPEKHNNSETLYSLGTMKVQDAQDYPKKSSMKSKKDYKKEKEKKLIQKAIKNLTMIMSP